MDGRVNDVYCFRKATKPGKDGKGEKWVEDETVNTLNTFEYHSEVRTPEVVCLNYQGSKSNNVCTEDGTCYSMNAMHGHDVHVVCYAIDSHPEDSRFRIDGGAMPSLTVKIAKGSADGPLVLIENERICCRTSFAGQQGKDKR